MKILETCATIHASPEKIWAALIDFSAYPSWNPFIRSIAGIPRLGEKISARIEPPGGQAMTFHPQIIRFAEGKELRWLGHLLLPGIFDGEHCFALHDEGNGTTLFSQTEIFRGLLVPFFEKTITVNTKQGFEAMNLALKIRCEEKPS
ncbi:SRPBCC domain-containing protein [Patescibacteria group bacterium]|nr:SRPBCC domain-containing protein [Patescibacteria group bacterium]